MVSTGNVFQDFNHIVAVIPNLMYVPGLPSGLGDTRHDLVLEALIM